jgi:hypothetical protein
MKGQTEAIAGVRSNLISLSERKKLRLKRQELNALTGRFVSEVEISLRLKEIGLTKRLLTIPISAQVNEPAITEALHHLVGLMADNLTPVQNMTVHTGESEAHVWIGVSTKDVRLSSYYLSDLSCLNLDNWGDHNLIDIINTMNNHFGDLRFRWTDGDLIEFILVFPKHLKLPWYLRDEPTSTSAQPHLSRSNRHLVDSVPEERPLSSGSFFTD